MMKIISIQYRYNIHSRFKC